jgi:hypothetical protein
MNYKIEIQGRGSEFTIYELTEEQKEKLQDGGIEDDVMDSDQICEVLEVEDYFSNDSQMALYDGEYYIKVTDENENVIWEAEEGHEFEKTELVHVYNDGDYLLIDDYQKGHFFTYFLEADSFDSKLLTPVNTEFIGRFSVITDFKYDGKSIDREWGDTWSKGYTYYLS